MKRKTAGLLLVTILIISSLSLCACKNKKAASEPSAQASSDASTETETNLSTDSTGDSETDTDSEEAEKKEISDAESEVNDTGSEENTENMASEDNTANLVHNDDGTVNYLYHYAPVLSRVYEYITCPKDDSEYEENETWLYEKSHFCSTYDNLNNCGYCIKDISGDGIAELMLTNIDGKIIYYLYTLVDGEPYYVCDGYYKSRYEYMGGNRLALYASGGLLFQTVATYELSKDGQNLSPIDYCFTCDDPDDPTGMESYHNTIGVWDREKSELIENEEFNAWWEQCEEGAVSLGKVTPLSEKTIEVAFVEDNPDKNIVGRYVTDVTEYAQTVIVYDENGMNDVILYGLKYEGISGVGNLVLDSYPIYEMGNAKGDEAIAVTITFGETIPVYGIKYTDANGITRKFTLDQSGKDGSVYLTEY